MKKMIWPFSFYFSFFGAAAFLLPFLVLFYQQLEFTGVQIGLLTGIPPLITLVSVPFWSGIADSTLRHHLVMGMGILSAAAIIFAMTFVTSFVGIFLLIVLLNILFSPVGSLGDSATMSMLGEERALYGRIRMGGTLGWGIFTLIAGLLFKIYGLKILFVIYAGGMLISFLISRKLSFGKHEEHEAKHGNVRTLLTNRRWLIFLPAAFLGGLGAFTVATFFSSYLQELGADGNQIGFAFFIATFTEIPAFFFGNRLMKRFGSYGLLMISLVLVGTRSLLFAATGNIYIAITVYALGGMIFPAMWTAGVSYADEHSPVGLKSTAQGLFGAFSFGIGSAVGGFVGGLLLESIGGRGMYLAFGIAILVGLGLIEGMRQILSAKTNPQPAQAD